METFIAALVIFAIAISLTFVEDWCRKAKRPEWLMNGIEVLSILMFVTDTLVIGSICIRVLVSTIKESIDDFRED